MVTAETDKAQTVVLPIPTAPPRTAPHASSAQAVTPPTPPVSAPAAPPPAPHAPLPARPFALRSAAPAAGETRWLKALIYGAFGSGKTHFGGSTYDVPKLRDVLFIDSESGIMSIANRPDVDVVSVDSYRAVDGIKEYLIRHCAARDKGDLATLAKMESMLRGEQVTKPKQYRTVVIDSLTDLYRKLMYDLLGIHVGETNLDTQIDAPEWSHYGQAKQRVELLIRTFMDMPLNVVFICSAKEKEDAMKRMKFIPNLTGALAKDAQGFVDFVGFLRSAASDDGKVTRRIDFVGTNQFDAKHRFVGCPETYLLNPSMADVYGLFDRYVVNGGKVQQ